MRLVIGGVVSRVNITQSELRNDLEEKRYNRENDSGGRNKLASCRLVALIGRKWVLEMHLSPPLVILGLACMYY